MSESLTEQIREALDGELIVEGLYREIEKVEHDPRETIDGDMVNFYVVHYKGVDETVEIEQNGALMKIL